MKIYAKEALKGGSAINGSGAGMASCFPTYRNGNRLTNGDYDLYLLLLENIKSSEFNLLLKSKLGNHSESEFREAISMFENGYIPTSDVLNKDWINIDEYKVEFPKAAAIDELLDKNIKELHERSFRVKEEDDFYFEYALLDKNTKELLAVGNEQGNYSGGLYAAYYHANWNAAEEMSIIKRRHPELYKKIIKEQLK